MDLNNKIVLITGAARGLGKLFTEEFLKRGAKVYIADILKEEGESTEQAFREKYGSESVFFVHCDVTVRENQVALFDTVKSRFGRIDVVINNAGTIRPDLCIDLNLRALMWGNELAIERMDKEKGGDGGVIINIASYAGIEIETCIGPHYTITKFGVVAVSRCLYALLEAKSASHGIRINTLCPTYIRSDMTKPIENLPKDHSIFKSIESVGGWLEAKEVVAALMKLVTDENLKNAILRLAPGSANLVEIENKFTPIKI